MRNNLLLLFFSVIVSLVIGELLLRLFTVFPASKTDDPVLGHRTSIKAEGVDAEGFRNAGTLPPYQLVAIGDSHTYGYNVRQQHNWPSVLSRSLGKSVYSYSAGGYGIVQYLALFDRAVKDRPETIIIGFYPFNDLLDTCNVLSNAYWQQHARQWELQTEFCQNKAGWHSEEKSWRQWLAVTSLLEYLWELYAEQRDFLPQMPVERRHLQKRDDLEMTPEVMNAVKIFSYMHATAKKEKIRLIVLFIPSRALVMHTAAGKRSEKSQVAMRYEMLLREIFKDRFDKAGIEYVDALPATEKVLRNALRKGKTLYPDGHPLEAGYRAYAESLLDYLGTRP